MTDKAVSKTISIYESDITRINNYARDTKKTFRSQAEVFRHIIDFFFNEHRRNSKKDVIIHFVYPLLFGGLATFGTVSTQNLINILVERNLYFQELHVLNGAFVVLGALSIGLFIANLYWLMRKHE